MKEPEQGFHPWEYETKSGTDIVVGAVRSNKGYLILWQFLTRTKRGWLQLIRKRNILN